VIVDWGKSQEKAGCEPQQLGKISLSAVLTEENQQQVETSLGDDRGGAQTEQRNVDALAQVEARRRAAEMEVRKVRLLLLWRTV
jgi:hypothetical protein